MVKVRRKENESSISLIRRFSKIVQQSGVSLNARKGRFYAKPKTKREKRQGALKREETRKEIERLRKLGIEEEEIFKK